MLNDAPTSVTVQILLLTLENKLTFPVAAKSFEVYYNVRGHHIR